MNKTLSLLTTALALSLLLLSCEKPTDNKDDRTKLSLNVVNTQETTKGLITSNTLPSSSQIGVFVTDGTNTTYNEQTYANIKFSASGSGSSQTWSGASDIMLSYIDATVNAYYPYVSSATSITAIPVSLSSSNQVDYMYATPVSGYNNINNKVNLTMNHALSAVRLKLTNTNYPNTGQVTNVSIQSTGAATTATLNATNGTLSNISGSNTVFSNTNTFTLSSSATSVEFIVVPTGTSAQHKFTVTVDGKSFEVSTSANTLKKGTIHEYILEFSSQGVVINSVNVLSWNTTGEGTVELI